MQDAIKGHLSQNSLGNSKFTVSLFPENFGKIEIEVAFSEDAGLNVKMFSDNAEATKLLQQNISTLRESLASEKINELVIDLNREKGSDENFENDSSRNNKLADADIENLSADDDSQEERVSSGTSFNSSGGLDTYV
jgi:flagellar hook-length control protein FliK